MTDTPIPANSMHRIPTCCDAHGNNCNQGRECPVRADAIAFGQVTEDDDLSLTGKAIVTALCIAVALVAMCAAVSAAFV